VIQQCSLSNQHNKVSNNQTKVLVQLSADAEFNLPRRRRRRCDVSTL